MTRKSFRSLLAADGPLILPGAHDALAARLIQRAGFGGFFIGGFGAVGARFGVPDIGLKSLGDISLAVRDILAACDLPVLVDADDGYGDVKNVVHTVHTYEKMGVGALFLEDQRWPSAAATSKARPSCRSKSTRRKSAPRPGNASIRTPSSSRAPTRAR